jgi:anti-sigma-K factor RskA
MSEDAEAMDPHACANAAPYVLGALTDDEHEAFGRHMAACAICREEVVALQAVAAALPAAAPQLTAPSELKQKVMSAVYEDARRLPRIETRRVRRRAPLGGLGWRPALGGLAAAAAVIALAVISLTSGGGSGTRVIRAQALAPGARAVLRLTGGRAELSIAGMPQSPAGHIYEVWLKGSAGAQPTDALFTVSSTGDATVDVPGVVPAIREVMVTAEPLGGSRVPTSRPVIVAHVS